MTSANEGKGAHALESSASAAQTPPAAAPARANGPRKEWKAAAKRSLKGHYLFFLVLILVASMLGTASTLSLIHISEPTRLA